MLVCLVSPGADNSLTLVAVDADIGMSQKVVGSVGGASGDGRTENGNNGVGTGVTEPNVVAKALHGGETTGSHHVDGSSGTVVVVVVVVAREYV